MHSTLAVDIGNYSTQSAVIFPDGASPIRTIRSLVYDCTQVREVRNGVTNEHNALITIGDKSYLLGDRAGMYKTHLSAAETGKAKPEIALPLLLASLDSSFQGTVKFLIPKHDDASEAFLRQSLVGTHVFTKNGTNLIAEITDISFYEETKAAAEYAFHVGSVAPHDTLFVLDIGGGTVNYGIFTYEQDIFDCLYYKSNANSGGIELAKAIATTDLVQSFSWTTDISRIMSAISQGRTFIGNRPDLDFRPVYEDCVSKWFKSLLSKAKSDVNSFFPDVTKIVWVGGGAGIIKSRVERVGHIVLDNPQTANIAHLIRQSIPTPVSCMN